LACTKSLNTRIEIGVAREKKHLEEHKVA